MKYNIGDKVRVKTLEWYINNYNVDYNVDDLNVMNTHRFTTSMAKHCGNIVTIDAVCIDSYLIKEDSDNNGWTDDMFEGLAEEGIYDEEFVNAINTAYNACLDEYNEVPNKIDKVFISDKNYQDKVELCLGDDYEIVVEDGRTFVQKKKSQYPKTYEECCQHLGCDDKLSAGKLVLFQQLINARNAYWKIAGEEMGLDKSWEPNCKSLVNNEYFTIHTFNNEIIKSGTSHRNAILAFPSAEMRDAFYENFKNLIEECKNFL